MPGLKKIPVGIEDFREIRTRDAYYIDKTRLIEQLIENWSKVNLFTRPRRFGKTWNAAQRLNEIVTKSSMLIQRESKRKSIPIKILEKFGNKEFVSPALNAELEH